MGDVRGVDATAADGVEMEQRRGQEVNCGL